MRILLIDDHALVREGIKLQLQLIDPEFQIDQCSSPELGLEIIQHADPRIDLIFLDLSLKGFSDLEALSYMREHAEEVPVVVLSGTEDTSAVMRSIDLGAHGFIHKNAESMALRAGLQMVLSGGVCLPRVSVHSQALPHKKLDDQAQSLEALGLTPRQIDVLHGLVRGLPNKVIARDLGIGDGTVKTHVAKILELLGATNRTQVVFEMSRRNIQLGPLSKDLVS